MGWLTRTRELLPAPPGGAGRVARSCPSGAGRVLHEGRGLLEEGRGYSMGVGGSCSTHNPWAVDPHPRGVGRLGAGAGRHRRRSTTSGSRTSARRARAEAGRVRTRHEGVGHCRKNPGLHPAGGPVSTALTSTSPPPKHSVEIVGMLRSLLDVRRRCAFDVSTVDTAGPPGRLRPATHCAHHITRGTGGDEVGAALHSRMCPRRRLEPVTAGTDTCQEKTSDEEVRGDKQ